MWEKDQRLKLLRTLLKKEGVRDVIPDEVLLEQSKGFELATSKSEMRIVWNAFVLRMKFDALFRG